MHKALLHGESETPHGYFFPTPPKLLNNERTWQFNSRAQAAGNIIASRYRRLEKNPQTTTKQTPIPRRSMKRNVSRQAIPVNLAAEAPLGKKNDTSARVVRCLVRTVHRPLRYQTVGSIFNSTP